MDTLDDCIVILLQSLEILAFASGIFQQVLLQFGPNAFMSRPPVAFLSWVRLIGVWSLFWVLVARGLAYFWFGFQNRRAFMYSLWSRRIWMAG